MSVRYALYYTMFQHNGVLLASDYRVIRIQQKGEYAMVSSINLDGGTKSDEWWVGQDIATYKLDRWSAIV